MFANLQAHRCASVTNTTKYRLEMYNHRCATDGLRTNADMEYGLRRGWGGLGVLCRCHQCLWLGLACGGAGVLGGVELGWSGLGWGQVGGLALTPTMCVTS